MKSLVYILLSLVVYTAYSQNTITIGEVFDFNVNDEFHYDLIDNTMPHAYRVKIIDRQYSQNFDTVTYIREWSKYFTFLYADSLFYTFSEYQDTVYYTMLDSTIEHYLVYEENFNPEDTTLYLKSTVDLYSCSDKSYDFTWCYIDAPDDTNCNYWTSQIVKYVKGLGRVYHQKWPANVYNEWSRYRLFYYNKGDSTCGIPDITGIGQEIIQSHDNDIFVFPNPVSNFLSISNLSCSADLDICIYNLSGESILEKKFSYPYKIDLSKLNPGMYILSIYQAKTKYNLIFVKQ